jgi:hypothetical protein
MLTPVDYAKRYWNLEVPLSAGGSARVHVDRYHIGEPDAAQGRLWSRLKEHFKREQHKNPAFRLQVQVNSIPTEFASPESILRRVVSPFWGKGSPEDCQITLQVALLLGEASPDGLQAYCDAHLGLDCNGFVGNYLWHERDGNHWNVTAQDHGVGPSASIDTLMKAGRPVSKVEQLDGARMLLLAEVNAAYHIIPGGKSGAGHVVITEPYRFMRSFAFDSMGGLDLRLGLQGVYASPAYWAVESTSRRGLVESWYAVQQLQGHHGKPVDGVFRVFRGSKGSFLNFRAAALD